ncbi:hypothetical protein Tcan_15598 [Toxocara canis]|nr:hypothetical protein Tcan_15598 [Toxocara canis]
MKTSTRFVVLMILMQTAAVLSFRMQRQIFNGSPNGDFGGYGNYGNYGFGLGTSFGYGYGFGSYLYRHYGGGYDNNYGGTNIGSINTENINI